MDNTISSNHSKLIGRWPLIFYYSFYQCGNIYLFIYLVYSQNPEKSENVEFNREVEVIVSVNFT